VYDVLTIAESRAGLKPTREMRMTQRGAPEKSSRVIESKRTASPATVGS
jgi:hypothetical protein